MSDNDDFQVASYLDQRETLREHFENACRRADDLSMELLMLHILLRRAFAELDQSEPPMSDALRQDITAALGTADSEQVSTDK